MTPPPAKTIVSLIFIDNYTDVLESADELRFPLLTAAIDRMLSSLARQVSGIIKKFDVDKYLFLFSADQLAVLQTRKFDILEQARSLDFGNNIKVTLSMGIGTDGDTLADSMASARAAIDLALGRGGDQVLIKSGDKYLFYGGSSGELSGTNNVRARVKAFALSELINEAEDVLIMGHRNQDLDSFGAALGMGRIIAALGKRYAILLKEISSSVRLLVERMAATSGFDMSVVIGEAQALARLGPKTLLIVADTHRPSFSECPALIEKAQKIVVIDHHRKSTEYLTGAVLTYHEPHASSTSELVTDMLQYIPGAKLTPLEADALLAGITVDTKSFSIKTGAKTFETAAYLRRNGADSVRVRLLFQYDMDAYKAKSVTVNSAEIWSGAIAVGVCEMDGKNPQMTAAQAADELLNITGIRASFVLSEWNSGVFISARSLFDINVQRIMERLGGGGHQTVAGAQLPGATIAEAKEKLMEALAAEMEQS